MVKRAAVRRVELRRIGEGVVAQPVDVLIAAGRAVIKMGFVNRIAFGPQLLYHLLYIDRVPQPHPGREHQAPGCFALRFLLLAADTTTKRGRGDFEARFAQVAEAAASEQLGFELILKRPCVSIILAVAAAAPALVDLILHA